MSAVGSNGGQNNQIIHNNLDCQVTSCSGAFGHVRRLRPGQQRADPEQPVQQPGQLLHLRRVHRSAGGKPYPHGTNIRYIDNLFGKKYTSVCGMYGPVHVMGVERGQRVER